jgi:hypothetical protein
MVHKNHQPLNRDPVDGFATRAPGTAKGWLTGGTPDELWQEFAAGGKSGQ